MINAHYISTALGGKKTGSGYSVRCPAHNDRHPSLSITDTDDGKILVFCHAGCSQDSVIEILKMQNLWPHYEGQNKNQSKSKTNAQREKLEEINKLLSACIPLSAEEALPARKYLTSRGLKVPDVESLVFHPSLAYHEEGQFPRNYPTLIGKILSLDNKIIGLQRIYLTPDGKKAPVNSPKKVFGSYGGGALRYGQPINELCIGEGPETCLSVHEVTNLPVWSAISAAGLDKIQIPESVKILRIFADLDKNLKGQEAAENLAKQMLSQNKTVFIHLPKMEISENEKCVDWLDVLNRCGPETIKQTLSETKPYGVPILGLELVSLFDLFNQPEPETEYLVENLIPVGGLAALTAKPKVGKTTLAREMCIRISRGEDFLGRKTIQGSIIYLALEEKRSQVTKHFREMGADGTEPIYVYAQAAPKDSIEKIKLNIAEMKPRLLVVDTLFRFAKVQDVSAYMEVSNAIEPLLNLARETGTAVLFVHHQSKQNKDDGDQVLGSTAIFSSVDTLITLRKGNGFVSISTTQRYGDNLEATILNFDKETRTSTMGEKEESSAKRNVANRIIAFLKKVDKQVTKEEIREGVGCKSTTFNQALNELVKRQILVRTGTGKKNFPYLYALDANASEESWNSYEEES